MDNDWKNDVAVLESYMAQMKKVLECCKAGNSAESCLYLAPDLNARRLGKVATDIIDACVPICQQLQRSASVKATRAKEEQKLMPLVDDVTKVDEKMKSPSLKEVAIPDPDVFKKKDFDVPKENEEKTSFEKVVQRIDEKHTSLTAAVSSILEFLQTSQDPLHLTPAASKTTDSNTEIKKEEMMNLVDVKENSDKSSSLEATVAEVIATQPISKTTDSNTETKKEEMMDLVDVVKENSDKSSSIVATADEVIYQTTDSSTETKKDDMMNLVDAVVKENSDKSSSPEATAAEVITTQPVLENTSVPIEEKSLDDAQRIKSFLERFKNARSKATPAGLESVNASVPKETEEKKSFRAAVEVKNPVQDVSTPPRVNPIKKQSQREVQVEEKLLVPHEKVKFVAGRYFANVKRLEFDYDVRVSIPPMGGNEIILRGTADNVARAKNDIIDQICPTTLIHPVKKNHLFAIEGHRGKVMNELCTEYEVRIRIDKENGNVLITGKKERCEAALVAIKTIESRQEKLVADLDSDWG